MDSIPELLIKQVYTDTTLVALAAGGLALGRVETGVHAAPMRVVAIPLGAPQIDLPDRHGDGQSRPYSSSGRQYTDKGRILLVRRFRIDWECHGAPSGSERDFGDAEQLYIATLIAIRQAFHHAVTFEGEEWIDQQPNADGWERFGTVIKFTSVISIPVYEPRAVSPLAQVTNIQTDVKLPDDGSFDTVTIDE